mmetsp:Transcript_19803/g.47260  ORF Transcript_19803/g.47260 Transcript_19803/m.47260 type:complete len:832 (+) Transcript_19803:42-2537(+)
MYSASGGQIYTSSTSSVLQRVGSKAAVEGDQPYNATVLDVESAQNSLSPSKPRFTYSRNRPLINRASRAVLGVNSGVWLICGSFVGAVFLYVGYLCSLTTFLLAIVCLVMLGLAVYLARWVLRKDEGTPDMQEVSAAVREGAEGYFQTQYGTITRLAAVVAVGVYGVYVLRQVTPEQEAAGLSRMTMAVITSASFLLGAVCSGMAGFIGMWVSVRANVRVAGAARRSPREALLIALRAGGFSALLVIVMTVLGVTVLYSLFVAMFVRPNGEGLSAEGVPLLLVGYGFGASFVALFAQLGGGIYTKAADVGADLVGKVEQSIPEDDPRNPAVIADLVGDNVGDCAARGADLFESIAAEIISAMILGGVMSQKAGIADPTGFIVFPLVIHTLDLVVSSIGILSISEKPGPAGEDPYAVLKRGYNVALALSVVGFVTTCRLMLWSDQAPSAWLYFSACGLVGVANGYAFVWISQYYTDHKFRPVRLIAEASSTGHATNIIAGVGIGLEATAMPVLFISGSIVASYMLGSSSGIVDEAGEPCGGLFGTAVATMGMLSTAAYVLTMDMFGPIADNAGGIVEMSNQPMSVRDVTDILDAVGNTTKATTKGYAIGSAGLASFLLFSAYLDEVAAFTGKPFSQVDIAVPEVFVAGMIGAMMVFLFTAWSCTAVGRAAQAVVTEVRRQFSEQPGIMQGIEKPDYARCVSIVAHNALQEMFKPGILAVVAPCALGLCMRALGRATGHELLGAKSVAAMLMFATVSGILMALFLNTAGGAWDNAKKYVESGPLGGKGSDTHKATVTGDTVGDPFKDTAGPSLHVLIKMLSTITLVMAPIFLD